MDHLDHGRLSRLLGDPELAWMLERVRRRLELGQRLDGPVVLREASSPVRLPFTEPNALRRPLPRFAT